MAGIAEDNMTCEANIGQKRTHVASQRGQGLAGSVLKILSGQAEQVHAGLLGRRLQVTTARLRLACNGRNNIQWDHRSMHCTAPESGASCSTRHSRACSGRKWRWLYRGRRGDRRRRRRGRCGIEVAEAVVVAPGSVLKVSKVVIFIAGVSRRSGGLGR